MLFHAQNDASLSMHDIALAWNMVQRIFHFVFENVLFAMFQIGRECLKMRRLNRNTQSCKLPKNTTAKDTGNPPVMHFDIAST